VTNNTEESGTATIRRKPTSKSFRRATSGPKAVAPPTVPSFSSSPSTYSLRFNTSNNNNNKVSQAEVTSCPKNGPNLDNRKLSVARDLTLLFQQNPDFCGDSPTPTTTPVVGDANHPADAFHVSLPQTPCLDHGQE